MRVLSNKTITPEEAVEELTSHVWTQIGRLVLFVIITINTELALVNLHLNSSDSEMATFNNAISMNLLGWQTDAISMAFDVFTIWMLMPTILGFATALRFYYQNRGSMTESDREVDG